MVRIAAVQDDRLALALPDAANIRNRGLCRRRRGCKRRERDDPNEFRHSPPPLQTTGQRRPKTCATVTMPARAPPTRAAGLVHVPAYACPTNRGANAP